MALSTAGLFDVGFGAGLTTNFLVQYEDTLPNQALVIANANSLLGVVENEFAVTINWFTTPSNAPGTKFGPSNRQVVNVNLPDTLGVGGALGFPGGFNNGFGLPLNLDSQNLTNDGAANAAGRLKMVFMNEWVEILMALSDGQWNAGASSGEGLSQYCGILRFSTAHYQYYQAPFVNAWLGSARDETFLFADELTDQNAVSYGCALLFLFYLDTQLGFSTADIIQARGQTLFEKYSTLTGDTTDPVLFKPTLEKAFPRASTIKGNFDNPFPLPSDRSLSVGRYIAALPANQHTNSVAAIIKQSGKASLRPALNSNRHAALV